MVLSQPCLWLKHWCRERMGPIESSLWLQHDIYWLNDTFLCTLIREYISRETYIIITARKRSLRRLCFYRCLSVHTGGVCMVLFGEGGVCGFIGGHAWFYLGGVCGFIWGEVCVVLFGGHARFYLGGVHGFIWGACMVLFGGHTWFYLGGMHGFIGGHAWFYLGGVCGFIWGGMHGFFQFFQIQWDTVNERAVRILLEYILVCIKLFSSPFYFTFYDFLYHVVLRSSFFSIPFSFALLIHDI